MGYGWCWWNGVLMIMLKISMSWGQKKTALDAWMGATSCSGISNVGPWCTCCSCRPLPNIVETMYQKQSHLISTDFVCSREILSKCRAISHRTFYITSKGYITHLSKEHVDVSYLSESCLRTISGNGMSVACAGFALLMAVLFVEDRR